MEISVNVESIKKAFEIATFTGQLANISFILENAHTEGMITVDELESFCDVMEVVIDRLENDVPSEVMNALNEAS